MELQLRQQISARSASKVRRNWVSLLDDILRPHGLIGTLVHLLAVHRPFRGAAPSAVIFMNSPIFTCPCVDGYNIPLGCLGIFNPSTWSTWTVSSVKSDKLRIRTDFFGLVSIYLNFFCCKHRYLTNVTKSSCFLLFILFSPLFSLPSLNCRKKKCPFASRISIYDISNIILWWPVWNIFVYEKGHIWRNVFENDRKRF